MKLEDTHPMRIDFDAEKKYFDEIAAKTVVTRMSQATLDRYANPRFPRRYSKEMMFSLLPKHRPLRLLDIGSGEGESSILLAHCGVDVTGLDISPTSIAVAQRRAAIHAVNINFVHANVFEMEDFGDECYDVVWCEEILHHLIEPLDSIISKVWKALRVGGRFIAREPIQCNRWLQTVRRMFPVQVDATPNERPLGPEEFAVLEKYFPTLQRRFFRAFARIDRITQRSWVCRSAALLDSLLLRLKGFRSLAGSLVMWADKT